MPGAWEAVAPQVLVGVLTRGTVATKWSVGFRNLQIPAASDIMMPTGMPFDHGRNTVCQVTIERGFRWLFFLDDDVIPPPDTIQRLINRDVDIVSGLYYRRAEPIMPVSLYDSKPKPVFTTNIEFGQLAEVDLVGAGCLLIKRNVLEKMRTPKMDWFDWLMDRYDIPEDERCSEDFAFCRKAKRDHGFKVWLDTTIQCQHVGWGRSEPPGNFKPLEG